MLKYLNGKIIQSAIPNENTLVIKLVGDNVDQGKPLSTNFQTILSEYNKYITAICFIGGEDDQQELTELFKLIHQNGLKTCLSTYMTEMSQLNLNLIKELDYLQLGKGMLKKDYSPFGDVEDWINI